MQETISKHSWLNRSLCESSNTKKNIFGTITSIAEFCHVIAYLKNDEINIGVCDRCSPLSQQAPGSQLKMIYSTEKDIKCVHNDLSDGSLHVCQFITIIMMYLHWSIVSDVLVSRASWFRRTKKERNRLMNDALLIRDCVFFSAKSVSYQVFSVYTL